MILEVENLAFSYTRGRELFRDVGFMLDKGQVMSILGANGVGKSTLLCCIANLLRPSSGTIRLSGKEMSKMSLREASKIIGYVPQTHTPAYGYAVRDFVVMGRAPHIGALSQPDDRDYSLVDEMLDEMGISHLADRPYTHLSGGERQQATIARAIVQQPDIILLDEPTNHLDYGNQLRTIKMVDKLARKGFGVLMTSHNPDHVILLGGSVGIMGNDGSFTVGNSKDILTQERLSSLYKCDLYISYVEEAKRYACIPGAC